jgi:hypothetical protein
MSGMSRWIREPLLQFIIAGAILFGAYSIFDGDGPDQDDLTIEVDRSALLSFLQYRANAFDPDTFNAALDAMSDTELQQFIDAYIDEEILYREAMELGLDSSDNVIRQRMVQKMSFLITDLASASSAPDPEELEAFFAENIDAYAIQPWATFTHVYFDADKRGEAQARQDAEDALRDLNASGAGFNDATGSGDNFPFLRNYVERTFEYIASHFGYEFVAGIQSLTPSEQNWMGPIRSAYGFHIVLMTERVERRYPDLNDVRSTVEQDFASEAADALRTEMTRSLRDRYDIEIGQIR